MKRYTLHIYFKRGGNIVEEFKTLRQLTLYSDLIDETVIRAYVVDNINGEIVKDLKSTL